MFVLCARIKYTKLLVCQTVPLDSVTVQHARMRGQTRQNRGTGVALGPIENLGEKIPIRLLAEIGVMRFCTGNDDAIETVLPQIFEGEIKAVQMPLPAICPRHSLTNTV